MVGSPGQTVAGVPLLETKRYIPRWRPGLVSRPRLIERLDQGAERKLTLVSAPAGFGKTTLLAEWLATTPAGERAAGWVSLDPSDNDPARFWAYVIAALQSIHPGFSANALSLLHSPQPPPIESVLTTVINELAAVENDVTLILDDFHVIDAQPIHTAIAFLLDHLPPRMHLVIASRSDPPLPLARLRAHGQSIELRAADLRFTPDEAAAFLNEVMRLALSAGDVATLETRTEGWIAGLQLAALSMQGRKDTSDFIRAFAGHDRYIVDYLVEEVLQRQPDHIRRFLLQTSILDRLSGPLCDAVTGRDDSKGVLDALERDNLFVVPLDDRRHWYRYHHLFADVLRAHSMEEQADQGPVLHRRAATWFEARGMAAEAIEQARAAGDHQTVARLLVANFDQFERIGQFASIALWAASLPVDMVRERPRLALIRAAGALRTDSNLAAARTFMSWAEDAIRRLEQSGGVDQLDDGDGTVVGFDGLDALKGEMLAFKLQMARDLSPDEMARIASQALDLLPPHKHRVRGMILMIDAAIQSERSDLRSALSNIDRSVDEARRSQDPLLIECVLEHRGQVCMALGRLDDARHSFEEALVVGQLVSAEAAWAMCGAHASLAEVLLERGDLAGALDQVANALDLARTSPMRSFVLFARAIAAEVLLAAGDTNAATEQLHAAQAFAHGVRTFRFASYLSAVELTFACQVGNLDAATEVARRRSLSPTAAVSLDNEREMTAYARYLVARGDHRDAAHLLARLLPFLRDSGRVQHEIHALVLQALAHDRMGERSLALESLGRATMLGEPGRFTRTFTAQDPAVTGLVAALEDASRRGRGPAEVGSPSYLASLLPDAVVKPDTAAVHATAPVLAEPITAREIEILRLIVAGKRNQEIADHLFISLPTVKRHIANAYGKLGVTHRTEAVARVNELNLL